MNATHVLAHSQLPLRALRLAALWAELDGRFAQGRMIVHSATARDYQMGGIELRVRSAGGTLSAVWAGHSALLTPRSRVDLIQAAQAWVMALSHLERAPELGYACLDALSALLTAGFETVHLARGNQTVQPEPAEDSSTAAAFVPVRTYGSAVGEVAFA